VDAVVDNKLLLEVVAPAASDCRNARENALLADGGGRAVVVGTELVEGEVVVGIDGNDLGGNPERRVVEVRSLDEAVELAVANALVLVDEQHIGCYKEVQQLCRTRESRHMQLLSHGYVIAS